LAIRERQREGLRASRVAFYGILGLAFATRLAPLLAQHKLGGYLEYDDGVYLGASLELLAGKLPYSDFVLVQPPGIVLLLTPFAALARLVGDADALVLARLAFMGVGVANTALIMRILRRYGPAAMLVGGFTYATWTPVLAPERTILLEPLLSLFTLSAVAVVWDRETSLRRAAGCGALLGAAVTVKVWPLLLIPVFGLWVWRRDGCRRALALAGAAAGTAAAIALPFFLAAPGRMFDQVGLDQLMRPAEGVGVVQRLRTFGIAPRLIYAIPGPVFVLALILFLAAAGAIAFRDRRLQLWLALLAVELAQLLLAPTFYYHYAAYAGPAAVVLWAVLAGRLYERARAMSARRPPLRWAMGAFVLVLASYMVLSGTRRSIGFAVDKASLTGFLARHHCSWAAAVTLEVGDGFRRQVRRGCPAWVDSVGVLMDSGRRQFSRDRPLGDQAGLVEPWQRGIRRQLAASDAVVMVPSKQEDWNAETARFFHARFRATGGTGGFVYWIRR
jgi:hypothetical protein